jgi:hypothetical protein
VAKGDISQFQRRPLERKEDARPRHRTGGENPRSGDSEAYFAELKRFSISGQFTTLHQAAMYSGRRF